MNTKNNKLRQTSKQKIYEAFVELMQNKDFKEITISDICSLANINRSTFYSNYVDIYDLVDKIGEKAFLDFENLHQNENGDDYLMKLLIYIKENQSFYKTYLKLKNISYFKYTTFHSNHDTRKNKVYNDYHTAFVKAGMSKAINLWLERDCDISPNELFAILTNFTNFNTSSK
ncbi:MAG: TetR/AcrR family transcriptional regulator [Anaerotignum sp.]